MPPRAELKPAPQVRRESSTRAGTAVVVEGPVKGPKGTELKTGQATGEKLQLKTGRVVELGAFNPQATAQRQEKPGDTLVDLRDVTGITESTAVRTRNGQDLTDMKSNGSCNYSCSTQWSCC